jgi:hypothetical protein
MKRHFGYTAVELVMTVFLLVILQAAVVGWVWNIVKLVAMNFEPLTGLLIVRVVGIFIPPLGAVVGYF